MVKIKINDFVITIKKIEDIEEKSVGLVENVLNEQITIFLLGIKKSIKVMKNNILLLDINHTFFY